MLGQEAENLEQHMQAIDQQLSELNAVRQSIEAIKEGKQTEMLSNLGKGIFVKTEIKGKELFVNIGKEVIIKKTPEETIKIIQEQSEKLLTGKEEITSRIEQLQVEMRRLLSEMQATEGNSKQYECEGCEEECDGNCDCKEPCEDCKHKH